MRTPTASFTRRIAICGIAFLFLIGIGNGAKAELSRDILIKGPGAGAAVYYYAENGKRYVFPNQRVYNSWFKDFSWVTEVTPEQLASIPLGGNVTYRPGIRMVKITTDPKVYAVDRGGLLRWVTTEEVARTMYGSDWNKKIDDVPDSFFVNYRVGPPIYSVGDFSPASIAQTTLTIDVDKSLPASGGARTADTIADIGDSLSQQGFLPTSLTNRQIIDLVSPAVVYIQTTTGTGSGFIIDAIGSVLTNAHVVEGVSTVIIKLPDGRQFSAQVIGRDEIVDLALLKISTQVGDFPSLKFESLQSPRSGDEVFTFGYPFGIEGSPSFKEGTISREFILDNISYFETSAEIHPGNSGGALVNRYGNVVGMPSFIFGKSISGIILGETIKFSITGSAIQAYLPLLKNGRNVLATPATSTSTPTPPQSPAPTPTPTPTCAADTWSCSDWSSCSDSGSQTRICTMTLDCSGVSTPAPVSTQSCVPPPPIAPGTISVILAPDDSESQEGVVLGNQSGVILAKYRLTAQNEELKINKARISASNTAQAAINSLSLYDGATLVGGPIALSNGSADFTGANLVIPKNSTKTLVVKANLGAVGTNAAASGTDLRVTLCDGLSGCAGSFEARGTSAGSTTVLSSFPGGPISGRVKILRKTKPTVSLVALPTTTLTNGTMILSRFTITADAQDQVSLKQFTFNATMAGTFSLSQSNVDSGVREVGQGSNIPGSVTFSAGCETGGACVISTQFGSEQVVAAGTSKTYELRANALGTQAGHSVSTVLLEDQAAVTGTLGLFGTRYGIGGTAYNFIWSDNSGLPHQDVVGGPSDDWINGYLLRVLPSDAQTVTRS